MTRLPRITGQRFVKALKNLDLRLSVLREAITSYDTLTKEVQ